MKSVPKEYVDGFLRAVSCTMDNKVIRYPSTTKSRGNEVVRVFLDYVLYDSCSSEVRYALVESFEEQFKKFRKEFKNE